MHSPLRMTNDEGTRGEEHIPGFGFRATLLRVSALAGYAIAWENCRIAVRFPSVLKKKGSWDWLWCY